MAWLIGIVGSVYGMWLLYASGLTYILVATMLCAPGTLMYLYNRKSKIKMFDTAAEAVVCACMIVALVVAIVLTANGTIKPF